MAITGRARNVCVGADTTLLVEPPSHSRLPARLMIGSYITSSQRQTSFKVPILLKNETTCDNRHRQPCYGHIKVGKHKSTRSKSLTQHPSDRGRGQFIYPIMKLHVFTWNSYVTATLSESLRAHVPLQSWKRKMGKSAYVWITRK